MGVPDIQDEGIGPKGGEAGADAEIEEQENEPHVARAVLISDGFAARQSDWEETENERKQEHD